MLFLTTICSGRCIVENIEDLGHNSNYLKHCLSQRIREDSIDIFFSSQENIFYNLKYKKRQECISKFSLLKTRDLTKNREINDFRIKKCIKNISNVEIPDEIAETLALGNKFDVPFNVNNIPVNNIVANIENSIKNLENDDTKSKIRKCVNEIISNHNRNNRFKNQNRFFENVEKFQKSNKDLLVLKADKVNITVAADRTNYNQTIENILSNNKLYKNTKTSLVPTIENKCNEIISRWEKSDILMTKCRTDLKVIIIS